MMRQVVPLLLSCCLLAPSAARGQPVPPTPNDDDIPKPVPAEIGLAGAPRPDIARFLNVRRATEPSLSPDGRWVAFSTQISGEPQLWVVEAAGGWPRQLTFGEPVTFHAWSPDGAWILYGMDRDGDEREGYYLINPAGTRERELVTPADAFRVFGAFTRAGDRIAYATTAGGDEFDIHLVDVQSGDDRQVFRGRLGLYVAAVRPDGGAAILTEARGEDAQDVFLLDLATGELETLFAPEDRASYSGFAWRPDGGGFYVATNQDREHAGLAYYDVGERRLSWIETPDHDVEDVALAGDGSHLAWITNEDGYSGLYVRELGSARDVAVTGLPQGVYDITWAARAPVLAVAVAAPQVPGDIWTWDARTGATARATRSDAAGLDLAAMVVPEAVSLPARDGVTLHGLLYLPPSDGGAEDRGAAPAPVVLVLHGGPTAQARPQFSAAHQYLLARGIAVFDFNYRGSTGFGKTFARLNDGRLRVDEIADLADALDWLEEDGRVDAGRAAAMGGSYGGYLTMAALARLPDRFQSGVAFVGVSNWVTALEGASPQLKASDRIEYGDIDDPDDRAFFRDISPITHVAQVRAPSLILHGANDPRDPVTESDAFVRAIREQGGEVEYLRFPDEGHGIRRLSNRIIAYRRIAAFLERTLGLADAPVPSAAVESARPPG